MTFGITKVKPFRINFVLDGNHYSLNNFDSEDGEFTVLLRKEDTKEWSLGYKKFSKVVSFFETSDIYSGNGKTYAQRFELDEMEKFFREIVSGVPFEHTTVYLVYAKQEYIEKIRECKNTLQRYEKELEQIKKELTEKC